MKKRLALVLAGVMMVSSLAGCGSSKPAATTAAAAASETTVSYRITCNNGNQRTLINP